MSKRIELPIQMVGDADGHPQRFAWRRHWVEVQSVVEEWREAGTWWEGEGEKAFYRVQATDAGVYELYHDLALNRWYLYRIYD